MAPTFHILKSHADNAEEFKEELFSTPLTEVYRCLLNNRGLFPEVMAEFYLWLETTVNAGALNVAPDYNPSIVGNLLSHENFELEPLFVKTLKTSSPFRNYLLQYFSWYSSSGIFKKAFEPYLDAVVETQIFRGVESFLAGKKVPAALVNKTFNVVPQDVARHLRVNGRDTRFSEETMMLLVDSRNDWVLTELALNRKATPDVLRRLAQNGNEWVRRKVGLHENTPVDVLERLANDPLLTVRIGVAKNPNTPEPCLWQLAGSGSKQVMASLNKNRTWLAIMEEKQETRELMTPSEYSVAYADALTRKFPGCTYEATAGRKFDRIVEHEHGFQHVHAFVERETGGLIKAATWKAPQRNPRTGLLAIRHRINTLEGMEAAVKAADRFGSYLYVRR